MTLKILTHHAHGSYQTELSKIPDVEFYHVEDPHEILPKHSRPWPYWAKDAVAPQNIKPILVEDVEPSHYDAMLIHWHPLLEEFTSRWKLPTIFLEHTWPKNNSPNEIRYWGEQRHALVDHTVFITSSSRTAWGETTGLDSSFIRHSVREDAFPKRVFNLNPPTPSVVTACNEFISRDWACGFSLWCNVLGVPYAPHFDNVVLFGRGNENIAPFAVGEASHSEVLDFLALFSGVYFNPSIMSPIPMSLLDAVAVGVPLVSTAHCEVGTLFVDGKHGVISNDPATLRKGISKILKNPEFGTELANNAKEILAKYFSPARFQSQWSEVFERVKYGR